MPTQSEEARDPTTPLARLLELVTKCPAEVLENPGLVALAETDPAGHDRLVYTARVALCEAELIALLAEVDPRTKVAWAIDCAARILPVFVAHVPGDERPARALETFRAWLEGRAPDAEADAAGEAALQASLEVQPQTATAARYAATAVFMVSKCVFARDDAINRFYLVASFISGQVGLQGGTTVSFEPTCHELEWQLNHLRELAALGPTP